jgi:uncharacterized protein YbbK (DUF523 family)
MRLRIGVSACLLGDPVRYDLEDKRNAFVSDELARVAELVRVCPEVEVGMGAPREALHLVKIGTRSHMVGAESGTDWTERMEAYARARVEALGELDGYVLKRKSPSCGLRLADGQVGLFAAALRARYPELPIVEEHDADPGFVARAHAYRAARARKPG